MSGHSKWSQIKHKKGAADEKKARLFGKLSHDIALAAAKSSDPKSNLELARVIQRAREFNMPYESIERAVQRASKK